MTTLGDDDRRAIWGKFMSDASARRELIGSGITKQELRAVVDAIDQWIDDNAAAFNAVLPEPGRTQLTTKQKVEIFMAIVKRRWEVT